MVDGGGRTCYYASSTNTSGAPTSIVQSQALKSGLGQSLAKNKFDGKGFPPEPPFPKTHIVRVFQGKYLSLCHI